MLITVELLLFINSIHLNCLRKVSVRSRRRNVAYLTFWGVEVKVIFFLPCTMSSLFIYLHVVDLMPVT